MSMSPSRQRLIARNTERRFNPIGDFRETLIIHAAGRGPVDVQMPPDLHTVRATLLSVESRGHRAHVRFLNGRDAHVPIARITIYIPGDDE